MNKKLAYLLMAFAGGAHAQNPEITSWMINTSNIMGSHYIEGSSTVIAETVLANVESVQYSANWVYVTTSGVPAYTTGPFLDGNPSLATDQNAIFKFPRVPAENTGTPTATTAGNIGVFINGVALFDYRDGVSYKLSTGTVAGGPIPGGPGDGVWNRDAVVAEMAGFDCSKGHPAMGNYHHHQNPSAYDLDLTVLSNICTLYDADGLYMLNSAEHSPLIGFAYDGFPIYGGYGYANADGTGGITRMKSGYELRNITVRTHYADGTDVTDGPDVSTTYPLGYFREDYEYVGGTTDDYLDEHNGRFCVTPEYPGGTYAYFCTVDEQWNSAYPYAVGPTFYGNKTAAKVTSITEPVTTYDPSTAGLRSINLFEANIDIYPNPSSEFIAVQIGDLNNEDIHLVMYDLNGNQIRTTTLYQGTTIAYFNVSEVSAGEYLIQITNSSGTLTRKLTVVH